MKLAAIDLGTNSAKLLVGTVVRGRVSPILHRIRIVRLGEGLDRTGRISKAAADRAVDELRRLRTLAESKGAKRIVAVGTQALRSARNGPEVVARIRDEAGVDLKIISGIEEARLSFLGAAEVGRAGRIVGLEIGGGSTQFAAGSRGRVRDAWSLPLGAVVLTERFLKGDPPSPGEIATMSARIARRLSTIPLRIGPEGELVGMGGTVAALMNFLVPPPAGDPVSFHGRRVSAARIRALAARLSRMTTAEREAGGIERGRADVIVAGAWLLVLAMARLRAPFLRASASGLRHGLLLEAAVGKTV